MTALIPLRIEIERASGGPLVIRNDRTTLLTLVSLREPARQSRIAYAPTSNYAHGEIPLAISLQQSILLFEVAARGAESESAARAALIELDNATFSLSVAVTVIWEDFTETWACHAGSRSPASDRTYADLRDHDAVWAVSLPCHPVPTIA